MRMSGNVAMWLLVAIFASFATFVITATLPIHKRSLVEVGREPGKRTFCNAFTGCGRKRSEGPPPAPQEPNQGPRGDYDYSSAEEGHVQGTQANQEPVDDLARDILAEARLWEALQARNSMRNQHWKHGGGNNNRQKRSLKSADLPRHLKSTQ